MKELLEYIAKSLVEEPSAVSVTEREGPNTLVLELRVAENEIGKVIGKQGKIAKAIRTVMKSAAMKANKRVVVEII